MKKYLLCAIAALLVVSCSQKQNPKQEKVEKDVKAYLEKQGERMKDYELIAFDKIDSLKLKDTKAYKDAEKEKAKLEANMVMLEDEMRAMEEAGQQEVNHLYTKAKEQVAQDKYELERLNQKLDDWELQGENYVYSIKHRYKAKKEENTKVYEEIFIVDQDGNVIEIIEF